MTILKVPSHEIKRIAVFRALQLGDMLCIIPAVRALRYAYPNASITLLGLPWAGMLVERFPAYFNSFNWFPGYPGLPEQQVDAARTAAFLKDMVDKNYDLVLQMQGNGSIVNPLVELFGAKYTAGFKTAGHYAPDNGLFIDYPGTLHEVERHLALMKHLGIASQGTQMEFPITERDEDELARCGFGISRHEYVCVHPGSRGSWRQWPTGHFAALADSCAEHGLRVVVTGTREETPLVEAVISKMKYSAINAAGETSLGAMAALIRDAFALVSNCTGVSHIAAALQTRSIVISMDGEPERWGPLNKELHRTVDWTRDDDFEVVRKEMMELLGRKGEYEYREIM
jgi:ADP-heptose:LPS heptosyltransferase